MKQAKLIVDSLLEDDNNVVDHFKAWVAQRGGSGNNLQTFKLWLGRFFPDKVGQAGQLFSRASTA
jgi:hypothetical protein